MSIVLTWILMIVAIFIIVISFIMAPESNSFSGALVGSSDLELFKESKERGIKKWTKRVMMILGLLLFLIAVIARAVM